MPLLRRLSAAILFLVVFPLSGCFFRSHPVQPQITVAPLKSATQQQLIDAISEQAVRIQSMQATVDIDTSVGGAKKGKITDYEEIRGYVLARKPAMLRMTGLMPVVRTRAFDMVSDGSNFKLWIPPKNRFMIGRNDVPSNNTQQPLENLRPQVIFEALLIRQIDPEHDIAVKENQSHMVVDAKGHRYSRSEYVIDVIEKGHQGWFRARTVVFGRDDLVPSRQLIYNEDGDVLTDAKYENYKKDEHGIEFPWRIEIARPQEEYDITLNVVKLELNTPLPDDKFELEQPPEAEVVHLDRPQASTVKSADPDKR
jgi:outer membrane lipoprotein-sorting protein